MKEDEETYIDEQFKLLDDDDIDEDLKNVMTTKFRLDHISKSFQLAKKGGDGDDKDEMEVNEYRQRLDNCKNLKVVKFGRFL